MEPMNRCKAILIVSGLFLGALGAFYINRTDNETRTQSELDTYKADMADGLLSLTKGFSAMQERDATLERLILQLQDTIHEGEKNLDDAKWRNDWLEATIREWVDHHRRMHSDCGFLVLPFTEPNPDAEVK